MAKRKHAAALFEVFHNTGKPVSRAASTASRGYGWWFKGRIPNAEPEETQAYDENDPTTMSIRSPLLAPRIAAVEEMDAPPAPAKTPSAKAPPTKPAIKPAAVFKPEPEIKSPEPCISAPDLAHHQAAYDGPARIHLNRERREVTLRVPFNVALIAACGLLLCVGTAYITGRHIGNKEAAAAAALAEDARLADLHSSVLELPRHQTRTAAAAPAIPAAVKIAPRPAVPDDTRYHDRDSAPMANNVHDLGPITPPVQATDGPRIIGLNYLLIQNYPNKESAIEARDFLLQNGIDCTVEKVPPGFFCPDPAWMSVITTRGFNREEMHATEYDSFKKKIEKASDKFAGNGKFKRFAILPYQLK